MPLIGAGVSMGIKWGLFPSWKGLMEKMADELENEARGDAARKTRALITIDDYVRAAELGLRELGAYRFNRFLRQHFRKQRPPDADLDTVKAIWQLRPPLVITTNYDAVMRWGCPRNDLQLVANDQAEELALLHEATSEWPWLWYLHGTIERVATLILAGSDYKRLYDEKHESSTRYERALFELNKQLATRSFLYVGFSLNDPYVLQQITDVLDMTKFKNAPSFALMKQGEADGAALWANYNIQLIEYPDHGPPLTRLLGDIAGRAFGGSEVARDVTRSAAAASDLGPSGVMQGGPQRGHEEDEADRRRGLGDEFSHEIHGELDQDSLHGAFQSMAGKSAERTTEKPSNRRKRRSARATNPPGTSRNLFPAVRRDALEEEYTRELVKQQRLLLLSPRGGGARTLARQIAEERFHNRVSWLEPPAIPSCTEAEYFAALANDSSVRGFLELETWLRERARSSGGTRHLVVLRRDVGPLHHLETLGNALRRILEQPGEERFYMLVAGESRCASLRLNTMKLSLFSGAPVRHVPPLDAMEVRKILERAGYDGARLALPVHQATGGHPATLLEIVAAGDPLDADSLSSDPSPDEIRASLTERLARSPSVRGVLRMRLAEDDRDGKIAPARHARRFLHDLLARNPVRSISENEDDLEFPEIRLYYDGVVVQAKDGSTVFRCEAMRRAAKKILDLEQGLSS